LRRNERANKRGRCQRLGGRRHGKQRTKLGRCNDSLIYEVRLDPQIASRVCLNTVSFPERYGFARATVGRDETKPARLRHLSLLTTKIFPAREKSTQ
jgi:hypothetical protein